MTSWRRSWPDRVGRLLERAVLIVGFTIMAALVIWMLAIAVANAADRPMNDGLVRSALNYADDWWAAEGSAPPCFRGSSAVWRTMPDYQDAAADDPGCTTYWNPTYVHGIRSTVAHGRWHGKLLALLNLCAVAIHERGHNIDYGHNRGGIMGSVGAPPGGCYDWALPLRAAMRVAVS